MKGKEICAALANLQLYSYEEHEVWRFTYSKPSCPSGSSCRVFIRTSRSRRLRTTRVYRLLLFAVLCIIPSVASAHAYLVKSVPAGRATLFSSPGKIQLWFNERLEPRYSSLSLSESSGKPVKTGKAEVSAEDPKQLSAPIRPLPPGKYLIKYRVLSVDGHIVQDQFPFTVEQ